MFVGKTNNPEEHADSSDSESIETNIIMISLKQETDPL